MTDLRSRKPITRAATVKQVHSQALLVSVAALAMAILTPHTAAAQTDRSVRHYVAAVSAYNQDDVRRTLSAFKAALKADPGNAETRDIVARVYQEYAYKAHRDGDPVRAVRLLERGAELARVGTTRLSLRRDYLRVSYLRIAARIKTGDLYSARSDEDILFQKTQAWLAADDSVYMVIRRLHETIGGLPEAADVFADDRTEDIKVVLEGLEWQPSPLIMLAFARFALLGHEWLLARFYIDEAKRFDKEGEWEKDIKPLNRQLRARSVPLIMQSNVTEFTLVLESTDPKIRWRGKYPAKEGDREVRVAVVPGQYRLRCVKPGHTGLTQGLEIWPGGAGIQERCLLAAESRSITIDSPVAGERVRIEGISEQFAEVPFAVQLTPGDYMAQVERAKGGDIRILKIPFSITGSEERVVLNTTYGQVKLICLGAPCDKGDFRVQTFEEGWLGAEQALIQKERDTYLLPFGTYKITLRKSGYAKETHTATIGPGDLEPEIFTLRPETRGAEEASAARAAAEEAALPSLFRYHSRLRLNSRISGLYSSVYDKPSQTGAGRTKREHELIRLDVGVDYAYRFKLSGRQIPFVFFEGRFGMQPTAESQTLSGLKAFEIFAGGGFYQRFRSNVHAAISGAYHVRFDDWDPDDRHLSALGIEARGLLEMAWLRQELKVRFDYGQGRVQYVSQESGGVGFSTDQSEWLHFESKTAADVLEAIVGDPLVDFYLGFLFGGDYVLERRDADGLLSNAWDYFYAALLAEFAWRFDIGEAFRMELGADVHYYLLGPYVHELFLASQQKDEAEPIRGQSWSAGVHLGFEF